MYSKNYEYRKAKTTNNLRIPVAARILICSTKQKKIMPIEMQEIISEGRRKKVQIASSNSYTAMRSSTPSSGRRPMQGPEVVASVCCF
jgi:hypothetical protein